MTESVGLAAILQAEQGVRWEQGERISVEEVQRVVREKREAAGVLSDDGHPLKT